MAKKKVDELIESGDMNAPAEAFLSEAEDEEALDNDDEESDDKDVDFGDMEEISAEDLEFNEHDFDNIDETEDDDDVDDFLASVGAKTTVDMDDDDEDEDGGEGGDGNVLRLTNLDLEQIKQDHKIMNFNITDDNKYFFEGQEVAVADLEDIVSKNLKEYPDGMLIQVGDDSDHGTVVKLMDAARNVGVTSISLSR